MSPVAKILNINTVINNNLEIRTYLLYELIDQWLL